MYRKSKIDSRFSAEVYLFFLHGFRQWRNKASGSKFKRFSNHFTECPTLAPNTLLPGITACPLTTGTCANTAACTAPAQCCPVGCTDAASKTCQAPVCKYNNFRI